MWIHLPRSTYSPCAVVLPDSTLESSELHDLLARFVTSSGKSHAAKFWNRVCKTDSWMMRRSGLISSPSMASRGVESWIASLQESHAREILWRESGSSKPTQGISGQIQGESYGKWDRATSFWRTSTVFLFQSEGSNCPRLSQGYSESWPRTGSMRNGLLYPPQKSEPVSGASDCSSWPLTLEKWPTCRAEEHKEPVASDQAKAKGFFALCEDSATWNWPTIREHEVGAYQNQTDGSTQPTLTGTTEQWASPAAGGGGSVSRGNDRIGEPLLAGQASLWTTPQAHDTNMRSHGQTSGLLDNKAGNACLATDASLWATAAARDWKGDSEASMDKGSDVPGGCRLPGDAETFSANFPQAQALDLTALLNQLLGGISRADKLRALGNGVVPHQCAAAFRILWQRLMAIGGDT